MAFAKLVALSIVLSCLAFGAVRAAPIDDAIDKLAADSFTETLSAIDEIARSGVPHAAAVLGAMADRRLSYSPSAKTAYYKDAAGKTFDAKTGAPFSGSESDATQVRVNNRVRSAVLAAIGGLDILSPDAVKRRSAASAILRSRDADQLANLQAALAKEPDAGIRAIMATAEAAILLVKPDATNAQRFAAVETLRKRGNQDAVSILKSLPASADAGVRRVADQAIQSIESSLAVWNVLQNLWYGLSLGSVLLLAAIGLAITFGVMGVINMAHGEMVMLGAYTTFVVQEIIRTSAPGLFDWSLAFAIPLAFLVAGGVGVIIERGVIRFLYGRPLETLLATWGVSLILQQAVRTIFGPTNREVGAPQFLTGAFELGGLTVTWNRLYIIIFAGLIFTALLMALKFTSFGLYMRAVTQNRRMAGAMGIRTGRVDALTFGLGCGIAGLAGVALSQIDNVSPNLGQGYIIDSFLVVVFGGVGNLWGTLVGALSLGVANKLLEPYAGAVLGKIVLLILIILFIQKRPRGLFALKGRAVEA